MSNKSRNRKRFNCPRPRPQTPPPAPAANLDFYHASTVLTREFETVQIVLVGCGGSGAYVAQHISRIARVLFDQNAAVQFTLVDPDRVQEKNIGRQLFSDCHVGQEKAVVLARRHGLPLGLNTMAFVGEYGEEMLFGRSDLIVLVGCVDRPEARRALAATLRHNPEEPGPNALPRIWWLDCGNVRDAGRVLLGSAYTYDQMRGAFYAGHKKCISLPGPALQYPSLLVPQREDDPDSGMSCAELAAANLQSLNINAAVAAQAADMLTRLLITRDLKRYASVVNVESGVVKSYYVTPEQVARDIGKPKGYVLAEESRAA